MSKREIDINSDFESNYQSSDVKTTKLGNIVSYTEHLWFLTKKRRAIINLTEKLRDAVKKSGVKEGFALVSAMHITAAVYVNDDEEGIMHDMMELLDSLAPYKEDYKHHLTGEDNADAHLKSLLLHHEVVVPITEGNLDLGPWQNIFYAEFDGKRRKRVIVKIIGAS